MARNAVWCSCAVLVLAVGAATARAEYVTAKLNGTTIDSVITPGSAITMNLGDGGAPTVAYKAGVVNWTGNTTFGSHLGYNFTTFCIELTQDITFNTYYTYNVSDLASAPTPGSPPAGGGNGMGTVKADEIRELWGGFFNTINGDNVKGAAFQLAIWKIEYDWGTADFDNFAGGNFKATDSVGAVAQAKTWLDQIYNNVYTPDANLVALTSNGYQDQVTEIVPELPSFSLVLIGGLALAFYRRLPVRNHAYARAA